MSLSMTCFCIHIYLVAYKNYLTGFVAGATGVTTGVLPPSKTTFELDVDGKIGRASCRERV